MADKNITLHPMTDGVLDTTVNLYPETKVAQISDLQVELDSKLDKSGDTMTGDLSFDDCGIDTAAYVTADTITGTIVTAGTLQYKDGTSNVNVKTKIENLEDKLVNIYHYCGSVETYSDLPTATAETGDVYNVESDGMNYAFILGEESASPRGTWDALGMSFSIDSITDAEIDDILAT